MIESVKTLRRIQNVFLLFWKFLRHYATFKVRKFESLFYKINTFLQKTTSYFGLRVEKIFSVNTYTYFSILGVPFTDPCLCYFKKLQVLLDCTSIFISSKSVSQIFKILFQTGDINFFVRRGFFFSRHVQLKSCFSEEKNINGEIWDTL